MRPRAPPNAVPFQVRPVTSWKGTGGDFLTRARNTDDDRLAPAAMGAFQRLAHDLDVAGAVEGVIGAADLVGPALRQVDEMGNDVALDLRRIDEVGHAEAFAPFLLAVVEINTDDHVGACKLQALDDIEADAAQTEDDGSRTCLDLGGVDHRADAGGYAAADVADLVERGRWD